MERYLIALIALLTLTGCGPEEPPTLCRQPDAAEYTAAAPWDVRIKGFTTSDHEPDAQGNICVGVVISAHTVLTAAHCIARGRHWHISTMAGVMLAETDDAVMKDPVVPGLVMTKYTDVGLIYVKEPITLPVYPVVDDSPADNMAATVIDRRGKAHDFVLFNGTTYSIHDGDFKRVTYPHDYFGDNVTIPGDSGGPVYAKDTFKVVALNRGSVFTDNHCAGLYVRLHQSTDWIKTNMR